MWDCLSYFRVWLCDWVLVIWLMLSISVTHVLFSVWKSAFNYIMAKHLLKQQSLTPSIILIDTNESLCVVSQAKWILTLHPFFVKRIVNSIIFKYMLIFMRNTALFQIQITSDKTTCIPHKNTLERNICIGQFEISWNYTIIHPFGFIAFTCNLK